MRKVDGSISALCCVVFIYHFEQLSKSCHDPLYPQKFSGKKTAHPPEQIQTTPTSQNFSLFKTTPPPHLIPRPYVVIVLPHVHALGYLPGLLLQRNKNVAGLVVESHGRVVVANLLHRPSNDGGVVDVSLSCDLPQHHHHARLGGRL